MSLDFIARSWPSSFATQAPISSRVMAKLVNHGGITRWEWLLGAIRRGPASPSQLLAIPATEKWGSAWRMWGHSSACYVCIRMVGPCLFLMISHVPLDAQIDSRMYPICYMYRIIYRCMWMRVWHLLFQGFFYTVSPSHSSGVRNAPR